MRKVIALAVAAASIAATEAECQDLWTKADTDKDGKLTGTEGMRYIAFMRINDRKLAAEDTITQAEFMEACKTDTYKPRQNDAGAPLKGANSFTESQARDRATAQGVTNVAAMKKDEDGIWRGAGIAEGKPVQVAVDYKGNVVTSAQQ